jgi:hypothetical protein
VGHGRLAALAPVERRRPGATGPVIVGVNVARYGTDKTCLVHRHGYIVLQLDRHSKLDTTQTTSLVTAVLHGKIQPPGVLDVIGVGDGVADQLRAAAFNASPATNHRDSTGAWKFPHDRSTSWWNVREMHVSTAPALMFFLRRDWGRTIRGLCRSTSDRRIAGLEQRLAWLLMLATIPVDTAGALLDKVVAELPRQNRYPRRPEPGSTEWVSVGGWK